MNSLKLLVVGGEQCSSKSLVEEVPWISLFGGGSC